MESDASTQPSTPDNRVEVGQELGFYTVVESSDQKLRMTVGAALSIGVIVAGIIVLLFDIWLFKTKLMRAMRSMPDWFKGLLVGMPFIAFLFAFMFGRSFLFDATPDGQKNSGTGGPLIRRRWLWLFGQDVDARSVAAIRLRCKNNPQSKSTDRLQLHLIDSSSSDLLEIADEAADSKDAKALLAMALHLGELLRKPVRVEGEPAEMPERAKEAFQSVRRHVATR